MKPTTTNDVIRPPADLQATVWRYIDFAKFMACLEYQSLFFARCSKFDDSFEGSFPFGNHAIRQKFLTDLGLTPAEIDDRLTTRSAMYRLRRHWVFANCWHMDAGESNLLWAQYCKSCDGVCIVSTYERLRDSLPEDILVGVVGYLDYDQDTLEEGHVLFPFVHRRSSTRMTANFALIWKDPPRTGDGRLDLRIPADAGQNVKCDLSRLIKEVRVKPKSPEWFLDLVHRLAARHSISAEKVRRSALDDKPFF